MNNNPQLQAMLAQMQAQGQLQQAPNMMQPTLPQASNDQLMQAMLMQLQQMQQMLGVLLQAHYERERRYANKGQFNGGGNFGGEFNGGGNRYGGGNYGGNRYGGGR